MKAVVSIAVGVAILGLGSVRAQDQRLTRVLADWQKRQNWYQLIEYEVAGEHRILRGAYSDAFPARSGTAMGLPRGQVFPPQDVAGPVRMTLVLDFAAGRHRCESLEQSLQMPAGQFKPLVKRDVFDGRAFTCLVEMPAPQVVTVLTGSMNGAPFSNETNPIFFGHGRILTLHEPILPGQLRNRPDPGYLLIHGAEVFNGRQCLIVRTQTLVQSTTSFQEYWVDPDHDSAIVRYRSFSGDRPTRDLTIDYGLTDGRWLPQGWQSITFNRGKTLNCEDVLVVRVNDNPAANFTPPVYVPGTLIRERFDPPAADGKPAGIVNPKPAGTISVYEIQADGSRKPVPDPFRSPNDQFRRVPQNDPQKGGGRGGSPDKSPVARR